MKNISFVALLVLYSPCIFSQSDTIKASDFDLIGIETYNYEMEAHGNSFLPHAGEGTIWDYSNLTYDETWTGVVKEMTEAPSPDFPNANMVSYEIVNDTESWSYMKQDETGIYLVSYSDEEGVSKSCNLKVVPEKVYYGSFDSTVSAFGGGEMAMVLEGIGYGTVKTPVGVFPDAVLQRTKRYIGYENQWYHLSTGYTWFLKNRHFESPLSIDYDLEEETIDVSWYEPTDPKILDTSTDPETTQILTGISNQEIEGQWYDNVKIVDVKGVQISVCQKGNLYIVLFYKSSRLIKTEKWQF